MPDSPFTIGILSLRDLEFRLGFNRNVLLDTADTAPQFYRPFTKRGSKPRLIDNPTGILKVIQARIQSNLLAKIPLPTHIQGGVSKRSPITNATKHLNANTVVTLDICKCFPSITNRQVFRAWRKIFGCSPTIAHILTKLTTFERHLPQGAPTSTTLANIVLSEIDDRIGTLSKARNVTYSRFVDDLIFSGTDARSVINEVVRILKMDGFRIPHAKMKVMGPRSRHQITGIVANRKLGIPREQQAKIRAAIQQLKRSNRPTRELRSLLGRITFVSQVNPMVGASLKKMLAASYPEATEEFHTNLSQNP
jgi:hypothetical protein